MAKRAIYHCLHSSACTVQESCLIGTLKNGATLLRVLYLWWACWPCDVNVQVMDLSSQLSPPSIDSDHHTALHEMTRTKN